MIEIMLTTVDNPYDPFTDFDSWYAYDTRQGYNTSTFLDRIIITSPNLSPADEDYAAELAIDEIVRENVLGIYKKVTREIPDSTET